MNQTKFYITNNQVVLKRYYKRGFFEMQAYLFQLPEMPVEAAIEKIKNEVFVKEDLLEIDGAGLEIVHQFFVEENLNSYSAWVKNSANLFYISISCKTKSFGKVEIKKTSLKAKYFNEIKIISNDIIKTNTEVFYLGKKIAGADAASFEKVENTKFFQDDTYVYSYTNSERLDKIEIQKNSRYFVPHLYYFADNSHIYRQDSWTNKIVAINDENDDKPELHNVLEALQKNKNWQKIEMLTEDASPNAASVEQWNDLAQFKNYSNVFNYFFPAANAKWNNKN